MSDARRQGSAGTRRAGIGRGRDERSRGGIGRASPPLRGGVRAVPPLGPRVPGPGRGSRPRRRVRRRRVRRRVLVARALRPRTRQRAGVAVRHRHEHPSHPDPLRRRGADGRGAGSGPSATRARAASRWSRRVSTTGAAWRGWPSSCSELSDTDREVLVLYAWGELSYPEIAQALGVEIGTVRSRLAAPADASGNCSRRAAKYWVGGRTLPTTRTTMDELEWLKENSPSTRTVSRHHQAPPHATAR